MLVHFEDRTGLGAGLREAVAGAVQATLELEGAARRVAVILLDDEEMATYNWRHLRHEGPTDVITFTHEAEHPGEEDDPEVEILIGLEVAAREAEERGHGFVPEVLFYVAHGVLHGLGHDDATPEERAAMHGRQREALARLGVRVDGAVGEKPSAG